MPRRFRAPPITANRDQKGHPPGNPSSELTQHPRGFGTTLSQNIFNGFRTKNGVAREDASLDASRDELRDVEQKVLLNVVTAYMNVQRDKAVVDLRRSDYEVLGTRSKQARFPVQDRRGHPDRRRPERCELRPGPKPTS